MKDHLVLIGVLLCLVFLFVKTSQGMSLLLPEHDGSIVVDLTQGGESEVLMRNGLNQMFLEYR